MRVLVVGGTNGLGREIAKIYAAQGHQVAVAGRTKRDEDFMFFPFFCEAKEDMVADISVYLDVIVTAYPCDLLVYASGFYQEGLISDFADLPMQQVLGIGVLAPAMLLSRYLRGIKRLEGFIAITSVSQWIPRKLETIYTASKAGLAMLAKSVSLDGRINRVLVAAPGGMITPFWDNTTKNTEGMLDPKWVAEQIVQAYGSTQVGLESDYRFKFAKILRSPPRVEIAEVLNEKGDPI